MTISRILFLFIIIILNKAIQERGNGPWGLSLRDLMYPGTSKLTLSNSDMTINQHVSCLCWYTFFKYMYHEVSCEVNRGIKSNSEGKLHDIHFTRFTKENWKNLICFQKLSLQIRYFKIAFKGSNFFPQPDCGKSD